MKFNDIFYACLNNIKFKISNVNAIFCLYGNKPRKRFRFSLILNGNTRKHEREISVRVIRMISELQEVKFTDNKSHLLIVFFIFPHRSDLAAFH